MIIKQLLDEDFVNYKHPSMFIGFPSCTFKCERECGEHCCQNSALAQADSKDVPAEVLVERYIKNPITQAVVCGGLEPIDSWRDLKNFISLLRAKTSDDIIIYTGYEEKEIENQLQYLRAYRNIIVKFGRFIPNRQSHYDDVLGVRLASENQYARRIS